MPDREPSSSSTLSLSDAEIARLEARLFCAGGPPDRCPTTPAPRLSQTS